MANYEGMVRTNYFRIKGEKEFMEAVAGLTGECEIETSVEIRDGKLYGWFGSYSYISYCADEDECDYDMDAFFKKMQDVIAEDDAMILTEVGNEKLRYLVGSCIIVTSKDIMYVDIEQVGIATAREMLGNSEWDTQNSY